MKTKSNKIEPIVIEKLYEHPIEKVFNAFSITDSFERWIAPSDEIATKILVHDFSIGGRYRIKFTVPEVGILILGGEFIRIEHLKQICFTWVWEEPDTNVGVNSIVTADLSELQGCTKLVITHEKLSSKPEIKRHRQGWLESLERLNTLF